MSNTVAECVEAGAAFLDDYDRGWWRADDGRAIDLGALDLSSGSNCVLGQRCPLEIRANDQLDTPYYAWAKVILGTGIDRAVDMWAAERGFQVFPYIEGVREGDGEDDEYDALTAEWKRVIEARRSS
jgi:hypothetical protein